MSKIYPADEHVSNDPSLLEVDSPWKIKKIIPLVDRFVRTINKGPINVLEAGGGAGLILSEISAYIEEKHNIRVNKYALDLSPRLLEMQKKRNPDLKQALNEDISNTSLKNKEIDLTLLIDVLEHIPNPEKALEEIKRISNYIILKVPLDGYLIGAIWNLIRGGEPRRKGIEITGHVNVYTYNRLRNQIRSYAGEILDSYFTNVHEYFLNSQHYKATKSQKEKLLAKGGELTFRFSPRLSAYIFNDFAMFLVKCD
ncbi:MAG: class I SAM-dependent methyltransferase [Dehalococcoidales bacterium]|nr:class I SAM-dependent methyltransferase [Dehalococcoidales bacterium]